MPISDRKCPSAANHVGWCCCSTASSCRNILLSLQMWFYKHRSKTLAANKWTRYLHHWWFHILFPLMSISTTVFAPCFAAMKNCALMFLKYSPNLLPCTWMHLLKVQGNQLLTLASSMTSVLCWLGFSIVVVAIAHNYTQLQSMSRSNRQVVNPTR